MKDICQKYANKIQKNINSLVFLYGGNQINFQLRFIGQANSLDKERKEMRVLVYTNESDDFKCPKCGEIFKLNTEQFEIILSSYNTIKNNINGAKLLIENIIKNSSIDSVNMQLQSVNLILNTITEDIRKNNEKLKSLLNDMNNNNQKNYNILNINNKIEKTILIGLNNINAFPFMNATLQCFSNTKYLTEYFLNNYKINKKNIISNEYYKLLKELWNQNNNKPYSPDSFKDELGKYNPLFNGINKIDLKDLILFLLETIHNELNSCKENINFLDCDKNNEKLMLTLFLNNFKEKNNSPISKYFYHITEIKMKCKLCN